MQEGKSSFVDGIVLPPGGGKVIHVLGNLWTIKAGREDTGGPLAVLEGEFRPKSGAPAHVHRQHEETFYVLEGEFLLFFEELAHLPPGPPDQAKFQEIFEKYDQETVKLPKSVERK